MCRTDPFHSEGIKYEYEKTLEGSKVPGRLHPDFSFADAAGDRVVWEHLGMMHDEDCLRGWKWKLAWYQENGFVLGQNLFTSKERKGEGLKMDALRGIANKIKELVA